MVRPRDIGDRTISRGRTIAALCSVLIDTWPESSLIVKSPAEQLGSGMDPRSTGLPWPVGVCAIGALVVVCGLSAVGGALAAPEPSMLRPDAPPSGAVASPTPDQPIRSAAEGAGSGGSGHHPRSPSDGRASPQHPILSARPHAKPRVASATKRTVRCLPRPHVTREASQARSCSRGEGTYPTVSERSWRPRSPASRIEGPTAGSRPSRAHFSRWWLSVRAPDRRSRQSGAGALR